MKTDEFLLIGGGGFIGSNLAKYLSAKGERVIVADRACNFTCQNVRYVKFDYFSEEPFEKVLKNVSKVILLSCNFTPNASINDNCPEYFKNISRLISLLDAMKKENINSLYFTSSGGTIYGNGYDTPISESSITNPINYYGILKLTQEKIISLYNKNYGMKNVIFRISNPYGVGQNLKNGVGVITAFIRSILNNEQIKIFGDGAKIIRDYIYINDLCNCFYMMLKKNKYDFIDNNHIFNIGSGVGHSLFDVLKIVEENLKLKGNIKVLPGRASDVSYNVLDNTLIKKTLGIESFTTLESGIMQYCKSFRNNK